MLFLGTRSTDRVLLHSWLQYCGVFLVRWFGVYFLFGFSLTVSHLLSSPVFPPPVINLITLTCSSFTCPFFLRFSSCLPQCLCHFIPVLACRSFEYWIMWTQWILLLLVCVNLFAAHYLDSLLSRPRSQNSGISI